MGAREGYVAASAATHLARIKGSENLRRKRQNPSFVLRLITLFVEYETARGFAVGGGGLQSRVQSCIVGYREASEKLSSVPMGHLRSLASVIQHS